MPTLYSKAILSGSKRVEFRRTRFAKDVRYVLIYESSPTKKIVGYFSIDDIAETTPVNAWKEYSEYGFIEEDAFMDYYEGTEKAVVISISSVFQFNKHVQLSELENGFTPPQSHRYISNGQFEKLRQLVHSQ